jgi:iron complex outermembrane receptor protein
MYSKFSSFHKPILVLAAIFLPVLSAHAQLEEIVVTAQKRSESLQDVPVAVTAFTGETLKTLGITEASDLVEITPGLYSGTQSGSNRSYFLRGVGTNDLHLTAASAVGQYFDGITLTSGFHARAALFDMERVEVLKGPQNTLFGLNTTGGAINYISKKPEVGSGTHGNAELRLGNYSMVNFEGALSFDVGDTAAARIAVQTNKMDGPYESVTNGRDYGGDDLIAYRAAFLWEPTDRSSLTLNIHGSENDSNGLAVRALGTRHPDGSGNLCPDFGPGQLNFESNTNCLSRNGGGTGEPASDPSTGDWETVTQNFGTEDLSTQGFYLKFDHDFEWATLNLITSWDNLDFEAASDSDGNGTIGLHFNQADDRDTAQYEARLVSTGDGAFRWIAGVYYLDEEAISFTGVRAPQFANATRFPNVQLDHSKENLGIYAQTEFDLSDRFTLTTGLRYSDEEIVADYLPSNPLATSVPTTTAIFASEVDALVRAQNDPTNPNLDANGYDVRRQVRQSLPNEDTGFTVKLDWAATDDSMVYASFSKGFKGSAADTRAAFALVPPANIADGVQRLKPESLDAWELGYKGSFLDNRIQFDSALYFYTYNDLQQFSTVAGTPTLINAPESEITGLDANLKYANDSGFFLDIGLSLLDTEVTDVTDSPFVLGAELANSPPFSMSVLAAQDFELGNDNLLTISANVSHTDDTIKQTLVTAAIPTKELRTQPSYTLVNANATYRFGGEQQYSLSLFGKNLTEERYCVFLGVNEQGRVYQDGDTPGFSFTATCRVDSGSTRTVGVGFNVDF